MIEKVAKCDGCLNEVSDKSHSNLSPNFNVGVIEINTVAFKDSNGRITTFGSLHFCSPDCIKTWVDAIPSFDVNPEKSC